MAHKTMDTDNKSDAVIPKAVNTLLEVEKVKDMYEGDSFMRRGMMIGDLLKYNSINVFSQGSGLINQYNMDYITQVVRPLITLLIRLGKFDTSVNDFSYMLATIEIPEDIAGLPKDSVIERIKIGLSYLALLAKDGHKEGLNTLFGADTYDINTLILCCGLKEASAEFIHHVRVSMHFIIQICGPSVVNIKQVIYDGSYIGEVPSITKRIQPNKYLSEYFSDYPLDYFCALMLMCLVVSSRKGTRSESQNLSNLLFLIASAGIKTSHMSILPKEYKTPIFTDLSDISDEEKKIRDSRSEAINDVLSVTHIKSGKFITKTTDIRKVHVGSTLFIKDLKLIPPPDKVSKESGETEIIDATKLFLDIKLPLGGFLIGRLIGQACNTATSYKEIMVEAQKYKELFDGLLEIMSKLSTVHSVEDRSKCIRMGALKLATELFSSNRGMTKPRNLKGSIVRCFQDVGNVFIKHMQGSYVTNRVSDCPKLKIKNSDLSGSPPVPVTFLRTNLFSILDHMVLTWRDLIDNLGRIRLIIRTPHSKFSLAVVLHSILVYYMKPYLEEEDKRLVLSESNIFTVLLKKLSALQILFKHENDILSNNPHRFNSLDDLTGDDLKNMLYVMQISSNRHPIIESYSRICSSRLAFEKTNTKISTLSIRTILIIIHLMTKTHEVEEAMGNARKIILGTNAANNVVNSLQMFYVISPDVVAWCKRRSDITNTSAATEEFLNDPEKGKTAQEDYSIDALYYVSKQREHHKDYQYYNDRYTETLKTLTPAEQKEFRARLSLPQLDDSENKGSLGNTTLDQNQGGTGEGTSTGVTIESKPVDTPLNEKSDPLELAKTAKEIYEVKLQELRANTGIETPDLGITPLIIHILEQSSFDYSDYLKAPSDHVNIDIGRPHVLVGPVLQTKQIAELNKVRLTPLSALDKESRDAVEAEYKTIEELDMGQLMSTYEHDEKIHNIIDMSKLIIITRTHGNTNPDMLTFPCNVIDGHIFVRMITSDIILPLGRIKLSPLSEGLRTKEPDLTDDYHVQGELCLMDNNLLCVVDTVVQPNWSLIREAAIKEDATMP